MFKRSTPRKHQKEPALSARTSGTGWMVLGGAVALVGVAVGAQKLLPGPVGELAASARDLGLEAGVLVVGGLVLGAVGSVARALTRRATQPNDDALLLEQVANDMIIVKDALEQANDLAQRANDEVRMVQSSVSSLAEAQSAAQQQQLQQLQLQQQQPPQAGGNEDAIYRLAASLDQLGARMEQRLKSQYGEMQSSLDELNAVVSSVRRNVDELFQGVHGASEDHAQALEHPMELASAQHAPQAALEYAPHAPIDGALRASGDGALRASGDGAPRASGDGAPRAPLPSAPTPASTHSLPLGLLDQLDDPLAPMPAPLQPVAHASALHATGIRPVPSRHAEAPAADLGHAETDEKLAELRSLLTDERLRAALEQMRRSA